MAYFPKMTITNAGLKLLTNVQVGADTITFTKMVLGDGETPASVSALTSVVNPIIECDVTFGKNIGDNTYQIGAYFSNSSIVTGFWWREVGVFAKGKDGKEILYSYTNAGDAGDYIPVGADERVEKYIYNSLAVGNAESVTIEVNESEMFITAAEKGTPNGVAPLNSVGKIDAVYLPEMDYASNEEFESLSDNFTTHKNATNPHNIKPSTIGLGNVPNVSTNDQTPTYTQASTLAELVSGEKLSIVLGKVKKAIYDFIAHLADTTKHITSSERSTWNAKAPTSHASNATTYGVGTSSNYGHLKITDSLTSTDTDTAASAKAIKTVNDKAQMITWQPLKEVAISITGINWGLNANIYPVIISGVDFTNYEEYKITFTGNVNFPTTNDAAFRQLSLCLDTDSKTANASKNNVIGYARSYGSNAIAIPFDESNTCTYLKNVRYKYFSISGNVQTVNNYRLYKPDSTGFVWDSAEGGSMYFNVITNNNGTSTTADATVVGTLKIYGRGAI